jgi:hypothetical protein
MTMLHYVNATGRFRITGVPKTWDKPGEMFYDEATKTTHVCLPDKKVYPFDGLAMVLAGQGHWPEPCTCTTVPGPERYVGPEDIRARHIRAQAIILAEQQTTLKNAHAAVRIHLARVFKALLRELVV